MTIAWCSEVISQKNARREADRAPIRVVVATLLEYLDFEDTSLGGSGGIEVVGRTADPLLAVELVVKVMPDMVLVSIGTCPFGGLQAIRALRRRLPKMVVVVVSDLEFASLRTFCASSETCDFVNEFRFQEDFERSPDAAISGPLRTQV